MNLSIHIHISTSTITPASAEKRGGGSRVGRGVGRGWGPRVRAAGWVAGVCRGCASRVWVAGGPRVGRGWVAEGPGQEQEQQFVFAPTPPPSLAR